MNLAELKQAGGFIPAEPVKVPVEWKGNAFDVFVKKLAFGDVETLVGDGSDEGRSARMIAASILLGDSREPISFADACRLDVSLAGKLIEAINTANGTPEGLDLPN
ncbi:MAG: phage tail assembly chaperone family protein, TAC [Rhodocyclaceae bacterium]|nr:phage tail assembly chaperone family protein, TAC [Rhodocyclaceae bacterium]MCP5234799.1 phage tail assembly chaperone family protein, TAC [Zoogloeaceae bacterium]